MKITKDTIEQFLKEHPGATQKDMAIAFKDAGNAVYGAHKYVASVVTALRAEGKIADVERCDHCNSALTRGRQNLALFLIA